MVITGVFVNEYEFQTVDFFLDSNGSDREAKRHQDAINAKYKNYD